MSKKASVITDLVAATLGLTVAVPALIVIQILAEKEKRKNNKEYLNSVELMRNNWFAGGFIGGVAGASLGVFIRSIKALKVI